MKKAILWAMLVVGMVSVGAAQDEYQEWHQERIEKLTRPDGYLSLVGLSWLKETPVEVDGIGTAWVDGTKVYVDLEPGHTFDGREVESVVLDTEKPEGEEIVQRGTRSFYAITRGDWTGLRVKDSAAPTLVDFQGVERFDVDPAWRLEGRLVPQARKVEIDSVVGVATGEDSPGWAEFEAEGVKNRALLIGKPDSKQFFLVFTDDTAGQSTYSACRFLYVDRVGEEGLILDFNKSINPACAFTHFATCPLPPTENVFPFRIPAGEKAP